MKYLALFLTLCLSIYTSLYAQNEQIGNVKTRGRLTSEGSVIPGTPIDGAAVILKGGNATVSGRNGDFAVMTQNDKFYINEVKKPGYELVDAEILKKEYFVSKNPLIIVLETPDQMLKDKLMTERKIRKTLQEQLAAKEEEIERLVTENKITADEYMTALQNLYDTQERNEGLIAEMAERYSTMDFDQIDKFNARISEYILNGRLVEADSLLNSKGDILTRISELRKHQEMNNQDDKELATRREKLEKSKMMAQKTMNELLMDCYSKFEIHKMQHNNDSAAYYIKLRAEIDTTDVMLQIDAGRYICRYVADFEGALLFYLRGLRQSITQGGEINENVALCYNNIADVLEELGEFDKVMTYHEKALEIRRAIFGENHPDIASTYHNIASVYSLFGEYAKSLEMYKSALDIFLECYGSNHIGTFETYHNIGYVYTELGEYNEALKYTKTAMDIIQAVYSENHPDVAVCYNSLGSIYEYIGDYTSAMEAYMKSLSIAKQTLGDSHPDVALCYNNIGYLYSVNEDKEAALEYYRIAVDLWEDIYGFKHPILAGGLYNIGRIYEALNDYNSSFEYLNKALNIYLSVFGKNHRSTSRCYDGLGALYLQWQDYDQAIKYYNEALSIRRSVFGDNHRDVANSMNNIGSVYSRMGDKRSALGYYEKALEIMRQFVDEDHQIIETLKNNIEACRY